MERKVRDWLYTCCEDDIVDGVYWDKVSEDWNIWNEQRLMAEYRKYTGDGTMEVINGS